jgi:hypothetical protein
MKINQLVQKTGINRSAVAACLKLFVPKEQSDLTEADAELVVKIYQKSKSEGIGYDEAYNQIQGINSFNNKNVAGAQEANQQVPTNALGLQVQKQQALNHIKRNVLSDAIGAHAAYPKLFAEAMAHVATDPRYSDIIEASWAELDTTVEDAQGATQRFLSGGSNTFLSGQFLLAGSEES